MIEPKTQVEISRDSDDDKFIECAKDASKYAINIAQIDIRLFSFKGSIKKHN